MKIFLASLLNLCLIAKVSAQQDIVEGMWKASINRPDGKRIHFNLRAATEDGKMVLYLINADESMRIPDVDIKSDSIFIDMPVFESAFRAKIIARDSINGMWQRASVNKPIVIPFTATAKNPLRFESVYGKPTQDVSGKWAIDFASPQGTSSPAIGEFKQINNRVTGSVLSPTGDNRYLEGIVSGDSLWLSGF
ncbi:MAG: TlpA family protein disulfide reductase, partial [Parafilimonas sp.]